MGQFMKTMKNTLITLLASLATVPAARGVELPDILGDNAVLQQQTQARLWGWAKAGNYVQVTTGWDHRQYVAQAVSGRPRPCSAASLPLPRRTTPPGITAE